MKKLSEILVATLIIGLTLSCSSNNSYRRLNQSQLIEKEDSLSANGLASSSAAVQNPKDTSRKFIRTAEMKFRVKSVLQSTYKIEEITAAFKGIVTYTALNSRIDNTNTITLSPDSSLETIHYTVTNVIVIRVPNYKLDSTLKTIGNLIDFLDFRNIKAEDVSLNLLANKLSQQRAKKHIERLGKAIDEKGKKLNETSIAEEKLVNSQEEVENERISNLSLEDRINFSTVTITIYQRQETKRWLIANEQNIKEYEPGYGKRFIEAVLFGWSILAEFAIFITRLWAMALAAILIILFIRLYYRRLKK